MPIPEICIIAALAEKNRVIGKDGKIPWRIPEDMRHFRELTIPHPVIMGRKTYDSIGKPLPNRVNIIISRNHNYHDHSKYGEWLQMSDSLEDAIYAGSIFSEAGKAFIMGGGQIYHDAFQWPVIDRIDRLYLTLVEGDFDGDTFFPDYSEFGKVTSEEPREYNGLKYKFVELTR